MAFISYNFVFMLPLVIFIASTSSAPVDSNANTEQFFDNFEHTELYLSSCSIPLNVLFQSPNNNGQLQGQPSYFQEACPRKSTQNPVPSALCLMFAYRIQSLCDVSKAMANNQEDFDALMTTKFLEYSKALMSEAKFCEDMTNTELQQQGKPVPLSDWEIYFMKEFGIKAPKTFPLVGSECSLLWKGLNCADPRLNSICQAYAFLATQEGPILEGQKSTLLYEELKDYDKKTTEKEDKADSSDGEAGAEQIPSEQGESPGEAADDQSKIPDTADTNIPDAALNLENKKETVEANVNPKLEANSENLNHAGTNYGKPVGYNGNPKDLNSGNTGNLEDPAANLGNQENRLTENTGNQENPSAANTGNQENPLDANTGNQESHVGANTGNLHVEIPPENTGNVENSLAPNTGNQENPPENTGNQENSLAPNTLNLENPPENTGSLENPLGANTGNQENSLAPNPGSQENPPENTGNLENPLGVNPGNQEIPVGANTSNQENPPENTGNLDNPPENTGNQESPQATNMGNQESSAGANTGNLENPAVENPESQGDQHTDAENTLPEDGKNEQKNLVEELPNDDTDAGQELEENEEREEEQGSDSYSDIDENNKPELFHPGEYEEYSEDVEDEDEEDVDDHWNDWHRNEDAGQEEEQEEVDRPEDVEGNHGNQQETAGEVPESQNQHPAHHVKYDDYEDGGNTHFMAYSLTAIILILATYIMYHNKQKIIAVVIEGRNTRGRKRRGGGGGPSYQKLEQNISEAMPSMHSQSA